MTVEIYNQEEFDSRLLLTRDIKNKWIAALRSGNYKQGIEGYLCNDNSYCCLGVLCEIQEIQKEKLKSGCVRYDNSVTGLTTNNDLYTTLEASGLFKGFTINSERSLADLNDSGNFDFNQIANIIEKYF